MPFVMLGECSYCSPSGKPAGMQVCTHPPKGKKRESNEGEGREGSTKGKGGLYKMPQIPALPPKCPRSGITFHFQ